MEGITWLVTFWTGVSLIMSVFASDMLRSPAKNIPANRDSCTNAKIASLEEFRVYLKDGDEMTTNQGVKIVDNQNQLHAGGPRGPTLLEDFLFREKITHFDHERIPERVVHARGSGVHGFFQVYKNMSSLTKAKFLQDPNLKTPVFVRFSTAVGNRGSPDTVRDVRGFATKFYTQEGNYDLVGNNIPVFFIQDAIKFPDVAHALKPEPDIEIPQASSAHDNFWDFATQQTEITHMLMWLMSDRAIPRAYANMEGFGVNTFRLINKEGVARFVKFHWKPKLGVHSLVWDETQKLAGKNPDINRQDLWNSIEAGNFPEWELGLQIVEEADEYKFDFDILDATKIIPEELVPVQIIGKMVLNKNVDNFFAETEQVAFCVTNVVPGIDFSNDPLLQGRLFSYLDTQLIRLGGPNFVEIPINQPICPFRKNNNRDGYHRQGINVGKTNYDINTRSKGLPKEATPENGFVSYAERVDGNKIRARSPSFADHFSQATLFWKSLSSVEQDHIVKAFTFELSKCQEVIRQRMVNQLQNVDAELTKRVADNLGLKPDGKPVKGYPKTNVTPSPAVSQANLAKNFTETRKVAILAADGVDGKAVADMKKSLEAAGCFVKVVSPRVGKLTVSRGSPVEVDGLITGNPSVMFDALFIPGGKDSVKKLKECGECVHYALETYVHCKPIAASGEGADFLTKIGLISAAGGPLPTGVSVSSGSDVTDAFAKEFLQNISQGRFFDRENTDAFPV